MNKILITTGDLKEEYEVIDAIFSSYTSGFKTPNLNIIFEYIKDGLRKKCEELGGHAVINCHFVYRGDELFVYGTAVRLH